MTPTRLAALAALILTAACSDMTSTSSMTDPALAKPGPSDPTGTWLIPLADAGLGFRSDGGFAQGGNSVYADGACGVTAKIFATTAASNSGDATIQIGKGKNCVRRFTLVFPDSYTELTSGINNLHELENTTYAIPVGSTVLRRLGIASIRCGRLFLGTNNGLGVGSDSVNVTRVDASTWHIASQAGATLAWCENDGQLYSMPVDFTVVSSYPLP